MSRRFHQITETFDNIRTNIRQSIVNSANHPEDQTKRIITINTGPQTYKYISNHISTSKYSILSFFPKFLFEQFRKYSNIFFLCIAVLQVGWNEQNISLFFSLLRRSSWRSANSWSFTDGSIHHGCAIDDNSFLCSDQRNHRGCGASRSAHRICSINRGKNISFYLILLSETTHSRWRRQQPSCFGYKTRPRKKRKKRFSYLFSGFSLSTRQLDVHNLAKGQSWWHCQSYRQRILSCWSRFNFFWVRFVFFSVLSTTNRFLFSHRSVSFQRTEFDLLHSNIESRRRNKSQSSTSKTSNR